MFNLLKWKLTKSQWFLVDFWSSCFTPTISKIHQHHQHFQHFELYSSTSSGKKKQKHNSLPEENTMPFLLKLSENLPLFYRGGGVTAWSSSPPFIPFFTWINASFCVATTPWAKAKLYTQNYLQDPTFQLGQLGYLDFCLVKNMFFRGGQLGV